ncbi:SET domain-containing protein-lysine N-methyltransferase [Parendozoicomonas sp. Alg238-R29]|uniref:SET domain-containing protein-lysine N-methyltransferase n=1 Tax=Parendozoicomonas sp. Alg238-R29 TaxID=2993446 RepID=UPI00248EC2A3|nr:SET domain-containing protein-lysine N-methyltransferase [Parendozoicomonas sp. Alg238-R29]
MQIAPELQRPPQSEGALTGLVADLATGQTHDRTVQPVTGLSHTPQEADSLSQKARPLDQRSISAWTELSLYHDSANDRFHAPLEGMNSPKTVLSFSDLKHARESIHPENRVEVKNCPDVSKGKGAFAKCAFSEGEVVGFYTGTVNFRKPMPLTLLSKYLRLAEKKSQDIALPLHAVWYLSPAGDIQFRTGKDTYTAWSQAKLEGKNIEIGIDGEHSDSPFQYLNHSFQPNTILLTNLAPEACSHITDRGKLYMRTSANPVDSLLIPIIAIKPIAEGDELTFRYANRVNFENVGKDIIDNPQKMMRITNDGFPVFIPKQKRKPATGWVKTKTRNKAPRPTEIITAMPSSPQSGSSLTSEPMELMDTSSSRDWLESEDELSEKLLPDSESDSHSEADSDYQSPFPDESNPSEWDESCSDSDSDELSTTSMRIPQKRPSRTKAKQPVKHRTLPSSIHAQRAELTRQLITTPNSPDLLWQYFLHYQSQSDPLINGYIACCNSLNNRCIPHPMEGEWSPASLYRYFLESGKISEQEKYQFMPHEALWERCLFERGIDPEREIMQFCLSRLQHDGSSTELVKLLNLHGLHQPDGELWNPDSCHQLMKQNPLTTAQLEYGIQGQPPITAARILWRHARTGNKDAYHMAICRLWALNKTFGKTASMLNAYQGHSKGNYPTPHWNEEKLLQYVLTHDLLDLTKEEHRQRIPLPLAIKILDPSQKELYPKPVQLSSEEQASLSGEQLRQRLLQTYLTTSDPEQREKKLAQNLIHCFKAERAARIDTVIERQYTPLINFLNQSELLKETIPEWTPAIMYGFLKNHGVMTEEDEFTMMDFPIVAERFHKTGDYQALAKHCFVWLSNHKSNIGNLAKHLRKAGLVTQAGTQPTPAFVKKQLKEQGFTIPVPPYETKEEKSSRLIAIAAEGDSDDMKNLIEHYLLEDHVKLSGIASRLKLLLTKQLDTGENLETKLAHLEYDVWTFNGLQSFMQHHGITTKASKASATAKDPRSDEAFLDQFINARPDCKCSSVMTQIFGKNKPKDEFHETLGKILCEKRVPPALSPAHIRVEYDKATPKRQLELKYELILQTLQEQAASGSQQLPESLQTLLYLHQKDERDARNTCQRIKGYGIKIPEDFGHIPIRSHGTAHSSRERPKGNTQGLPGTNHWMDGNVAKIFQFITDHPFQEQEQEQATTSI